MTNASPNQNNQNVSSKFIINKVLRVLLIILLTYLMITCAYSKIEIPGQTELEISNISSTSSM